MHSLSPGSPRPNRWWRQAWANSSRVKLTGSTPPVGVCMGGFPPPPVVGWEPVEAASRTWLPCHLGDVELLTQAASRQSVHHRRSSSVDSDLLLHPLSSSRPAHGPAPRPAHSCSLPTLRAAQTSGSWLVTYMASLTPSLNGRLTDRPTPTAVSPLLLLLLLLVVVALQAAYGPGFCLSR